jgi:hypothetical protein
VTENQNDDTTNSLSLAHIITCMVRHVATLCNNKRHALDRQNVVLYNITFIMKEGNIIDAFGNPIKQIFPLGKVKLLKLIQDSPKLQLWKTEMLNQPGHFHILFIKKDNGTNKI